MLRFITQKFRNQSLNEVRPLENQGTSWLYEDLEELETYGGDKGQDKLSFNERDYGNGWNNNYANDHEEIAAIDAQLKQLTQKNNSENVSWSPFPPRIDATRDVATEVNLKDSRNGTVRDDSKENHPCLVPVVKLPRLDHASTSSCRRKFSDVKRRKAEISSESSSSDDEIKEFCSYGVTKYRTSSRPPDKMVAISSSFAVCQRRRSKGSLSRFQSVQRPSINFDRMQQTLLKRQRNRVVRVRTLSTAQHCDISSLGFKPITNLNPCINHLAPVENPLAF